MQVTTSFVQDQKHLSKSDRFVVIQPSNVAEVLQDHGFNLIGLKSGKGRKEDRLNHQTTIARYRSMNDFMLNDRLHLDIMFKIPHLTGKLEARLGFFRDFCANQWNMGQLFNIIKLAHTGDVLNELNAAIPQLVAQRHELIDTIRAMQARNVTAQEIAQLATATAAARMVGMENAQNPQAADLIVPRRLEDRNVDLFSVTNVLQENATRFGLRYQSIQVNEQGVVTGHRNMVTRKVIENSEKAVELNASIWDTASQLLKTA
jgi:hypothetical protein